MNRYTLKLISLMTKKKCFILLLFLSFASQTFADSPFANRPDIQTFIIQMVKQHQFSKAYLIQIFNSVKLRPQVILHVKKPPEKKPWRTYQLLLVNEWRIQHGLAFWNKYAKPLAEAEKKFGVPAYIIVATIGVETKFGTRNGGFRVIDSLTSLAFSRSPRAAFFRQELEQFLLLTREQHLDPFTIKGSYAGAIGQPQFMPSSYRAYAINFSKSGKIDLIHDTVDVIGSVANYYQKHGWHPLEPITEQAAKIGSRYDYLAKKNKIPKLLSLDELATLGVLSKKKKPNEHLKVKVVELDSHFSKEYWLGYHNFDVIKRYNASDLYAMAVYQLGHYIKSLRERKNNG